MNTTEMAVIAGGIAAIAWINWYFFLATGSSAVAKESASVVGGRSASGAEQTATIVVKGGYDPATIRVRAGIPVRLMFDRQETSSCSEEIVFPDFGIKRFLPAFEKTAIEFTPSQPGTYGFMCGMSMLHGRLIVEE